MSNLINYKEYSAVVKYSSEDQALIGKVINIRDVIVFEGQSVEELQIAFEESIDLYLEHCEENGISPSKPYSGNFPFRVSPELHEKFHVAAEGAGKSLNQWMIDSLVMALEAESVAQAAWSQAEGKSFSITTSPPSSKKQENTKLVIH